MKQADSDIIQLLREIKAAAGGAGAAVWGAITGTLSNQTDLQAALDAKPGYKVYTALLTQSGKDAPAESAVTQNTLGGSAVVWTRADFGVYEIAHASFSDTTTTVQITNARPEHAFTLVAYPGSGKVTVRSYGIDGSPAEITPSQGLISIEIHVGTTP